MPNNGKRILVAEDDRFLRRGCENSLLKKGYAVVLAANGEEAVQAIRDHPPDLVLLDLLMPKMSGMEVLRFMKSEEATRDVPVLILTNSAKESDVVEIMKLGANDYLIKANLSLEELENESSSS